MSHKRKFRQPIKKRSNSALVKKANPGPPAQLGSVRTISKTAMFSGPLPPPEILIGYNDVVQNGGERIIIMAEKQQNHRMALEKYVLEQDSKRADRGLILGFILAILIFSGGVIIVLSGKDIAGLSVVFVSMASLIGLFIRTQQLRKEERESRSQTFTEKANKRD